MTSETRNARIVAILVAAMTLGAAALLWLEPPTPGWSSSALLMAETERGIEEVQIDFASSADSFDEADYECVILPDGECQWRPRGTLVRMLVVGDEDAPASDAQARTILAVFGSLTQRHGLDLRNVWLHPASDARLHPELPRPAHVLCSLLERKGIIP